jgi:hypothetical protein
MIVFILIAQTGEAFAISSMSCFGSNSKMTMDMTNERSNAATNEMSLSMLSMHSSFGEVSGQSMDHECCQQECDCPSAMLSIAVLIDININPFLATKYSQSVASTSRLVRVFIPSQQRPPKLLYLIAA